MKNVIKVVFLLLMVVGVGLTVANILEEPLRAEGETATEWYLKTLNDCYEPAYNCHRVIVIMPGR